MKDVKDFPKTKKPIPSVPEPITPLTEKGLPPVGETPKPPPTKPPKEEK